MFAAAQAGQSRPRHACLQTAPVEDVEADTKVGFDSRQVRQAPETAAGILNYMYRKVSRH
ncbi:hypothetical protein AS594_36350 [Streptomyces agglomeratus]|uniref:Uncharacterized protein n=1 Tax=Streptomyces agglomeratus TaxID=285458 RepID=A0A1E5PHS2_9ACTN|nr:hypothetical protein AS594_36350 [Streptomyces agglomeratus]